MFEDSTFESAGRIHTRSRRWGVAVFILNSSILAALILIPLIYPEALPRRWMNLLLVAPPPPAEAPKPVEVRPEHATRIIPQMDNGRAFAPRVIPRDIFMARGPEVLPSDDAIPGAGLNPAGAADPSAFFATHRPPAVHVAPAGPQHVSTGVADGMVIYRVIPRYPPIALAARMQGTVVLQAIISKSGAIENLRVLNGPPMFQQAAIDAVSQWRYRPFLLDGQPVEVETTINVVFSLNQ